MIEESGEASEPEKTEPEQDRSGDRGERGLGGFAAGVLVGAVLGIGLGLLFAPARGDVSRKRLRKQLDRLRDHADGGLERAGKRTRRELERRRRRLEEAIDRVRDR